MIGRTRELERIEALLDSARAGRSQVLVVRGEAGIGKSTLMRAAEERAEGMSVLRSTGIESELELPHAALHQLVRPHLDLLDRLPEPQAAALRGALGLSFEPGQDRFLISLALLSLLAELADAAPVLCLVDDAQWLDRPSADALLFAARRLEAESIAVLIAARNVGSCQFDAPGLPELALTGLDDDQARGLAARRAPDEDGTETLVRSAAGNPLALLELPLGRSEPGSVEDAFRERIAAMPDPTRRLLLLVAADEANEIGALQRAAERLGVSLDDLGPAVEDGLVNVGDFVAFKHPIIRSAAYESATPEERRRAHETYAAVLDADAGDLRRIWHRAGAVGEPDEEVAQELAEAAARSVERGAHAAAFTAFERAADLSVTDAGKGHRLRLAARAALDGGRSEAALLLVERARPLVSDPHDMVALEYVRAAVEIQSGTPEEANAILMQAAEDIAPADPALATSLVLEAVEVAILGGWTERAFLAGRDLISRFEPGGTPGEDFMRAFIEGVAALASLDVATAHERLTDAASHSQPMRGHHWGLWAGGVHMYLGDPTRARVLYRRSVDAARATGSFSAIPWALLLCANADMSERKVTAVESSVTEGLEIARQTGQHNLATVFLAFMARVAAFQGREDDCRRFAEEALGAALTNNVGAAASIARTALAEIGDADAARAQLEYVATDVQVSVLVIALPELMDACARAGCPEVAAPALDVYELYASQAQGTTARGILARCRALAADDPADKQRFFQEAVGLHARGVPPFERARTQTNYGEFLRRARRRVEAREQLRAALATFDGMGAELWARRAREELEATGETTRKRDDSTRDELTPQELRIAQRVAAGNSNREVAAQLFISPKTVEYHLSKVFMKLGISSRVELARMELGEPELAA